MAKQTFTTGQVLTAAQMTSLQQTAMGGGAATAKTANYVLVAADAGTTVAMNAAGSTTITVNTGLFAAGDTVFIQNLGAGACTVTAGTATVATAGSLILPQNDAGILYFTATGAAIFYDYIQAGAVSPLTTKGDLYTFSTSDARLGVGANNTVLTADSSENTGLKWATPTGGGGITLLSTTTLSGTSTTISTIDQTYESLYVLITGVTNSTNDADFNCLPNNVNNLVSMGGFDQGSIFGGIYTSYIQLTGTNVEYKRNDANNVWTIQFDNYASTTAMKPFIANSSFIEPGYSDTRAVFLAGTFRSNTAISSLVFNVEGETFLTGTVKIYGVK